MSDEKDLLLGLYHHFCDSVHEIRKRCSLPRSIIEFIFYNCEQHGLNIEVQCLSIEISKQYIHLLFFDIEQMLDKENLSKSEFKYKWNSLVEEFCSNFYLRIMCCIEIASKMNSRVKHLRPSSIQKYLVRFGLNYSLSTITTSTFSILKVMRFKVNS